MRWSMTDGLWRQALKFFVSLLAGILLTIVLGAGLLYFAAYLYSLHNSKAAIVREALHGALPFEITLIFIGCFYLVHRLLSPSLRVRHRLFAVALAITLLWGAKVYMHRLQYPPEPNLPFNARAACQSPSGVAASGSGQPYDVAEAYEVYSAIIRSVNPDPEMHMWLIRIDTLPSGPDSSRLPAEVDLAQGKRANAGEQKVADTALEDYSKVNAKSWLLQRKFNLPKPYKLLTLTEIRSLFPNPVTFRGHYIELSAVGFNSSKTMALVYMVNWCSVACCCGDSSSLVLQKQRNGKWKILSGSQCWIS
jgi:hypothetical protein